MKKSKILRKFLTTASLCGTLFTSSNAAGATIPNLGSVSLSTGAGLVGGVFNNGDIIQIAVGGIGIKISADKANAVVGGINTLIALPAFGGVEVSQNVSIGPLSATVGLTPNFGPLKFISNNVTSIITGVGNQTFNNIDFAGKNSTLQINNGLNITTQIDNTVAGNNGIITFAGTGTISNNIGLTNSLSQINVGNGKAQIYMPGAGNSIINAANINLTNNNSILTLFDGNVTTLTGNINNTTGVDGQGILNLAHDLASDNIITGDIGNIGSLAAINVLLGSATLNSTILKATNINLQSNTSVLNLDDDIIVTGNINGANGVNGTLNFIGNATLNGNINNLNILQCSGGNGKILDLQGNITVNSIVFADSVLASGTISVNGLLNVGGITFNNSNASGGTLIINTENTINVALLNAIKAKIQINANLTINDPSAGDIGDIRIANNTTYTIDAANGNVNLLNNGTKIIFEGADSELDLVNTSNINDRQFTFYNNLNKSGNDEYGIVRIGATTKDLTIANNGGPYTIGQDNTHRLKEFIVDGAGNIVVDNTVFTKLLSMNSTGQVTFNQALDLGAGGNIAFGKDGTLVVNGVTGSVTTSANNQGTLTINSGNINGTIGSNGSSLKLVNIGANLVTFSANVFAPVVLTNAGSALTLADGVTLTGAVTTNNNTKGILSLGVGSNVTGQIGANGAALEKINIGAGASSLGSNIYVGSTVLTNQTSVLTLNNNVVVNGNITTTAGNDSGKLIFASDGSVISNVGANGAALEEVIFNGVDNIGGTANGAVFNVANIAANATVTELMTGDLVYNAAGKVTATGGLTGNIDFQNNAGTFNLGAGSTLTGTVTSTGGVNGTLNVSDAGIITGNIDNLNILEFSGSTGTTLDLQGNTRVNSIVFINNAAASGTINAGGELTLGSLTFNANAVGDVLVINAPSTINGAILNGLKGKIEIKANLTINDPSAGEVNEIDIADNTTYTIDAKNGNVDLLKNGAKIVFEGADSRLDLINTSVTDDRTFTLYNNLNKSGNDEYGIVRIGATTKDLTIANNGGPYTIGQDNTHRLKNFIVDGAGNIVVDNTVFTKLLSMNSTGQVTFNQALDLGAGGNILFGADGELIVKGVTDSVTTSANNQGTLTIQSGNVTGTIGANGSSLKLVNIGANPVTFSDDVFAPVALTNAGSALTLADGVTLTGAVTTNNNTKGILVLGAGSSVTGGIGGNNAALERVTLGAGASSLGGNIYSGAVALTDQTSILTLQDGAVVNGGITTTAGDGKSKLIFAKDGAVTGNVGAVGSALEEVVFNGADNIGGTANAETFTVANAAANAVITGLATGTLKYTDTGTITANGGWTGDIDFNNKAGTFILGANSTLTGAVSSTGGINGTLKALGSGSITGVVNGLDIFEFSGSNGTAFDLAGNTTVNNVLFTNSNAASGTININAGLNSGQITFNMGNANGGTLVINAPTTVGDIVNAANGNIIINADFTITDPDAVGIHNITIKDNTTYTIDSINGNVDLLANGAKIIFEGADSELDLINTSNANDRTFTLHNNLNPSNAQDEFGIVRIGATKKDLTIANNGGPYTIGQDNTHRLKNFIVDGAGNIVVDNTVFTKLLSMNSTGQVTFNQELDLGADGLIVFGDVGTLIANDDVTGDIDFHGKAGTFELDDGATIDGSVLGTGGVAGTLNFIGDGNVTGNIGTDAANSPATINIQGDNTKNITIANDIFVGNINFTNGGVLQLSGNLTTPNIDFGAKGGTLEFNGNNTYNLNAVIANGQNGILNVFTTLKSTDASIGTVKTINIGKVGTPQNFTVQVNNGNLALLSSPNSSINFGDADSQLILSAPIDQTVTFANSLNGIKTGGGIVTLDGNGNNLTVSGNNGATFGTVGNELASLNIKGKVTVTNNLDVQNIQQLNINNGAVFTDQSLTSAKIANISIGEVTGSATYALDAVNSDFDLNTGGMVFEHQDSVLELKNSSNANDRTITLTAALDPGNDQFGIVNLTTDTNKLTIDNNGNAAYTLGTVNHRLKQLTFSSTGNGAIALNVGINVENIALNVKTIELGVVNANVLFNKNATYTATGDINGNVDFQGNAGVINLNDGIKIDGIVTSTGNVNGTLNWGGAGEVTGLITNIAMLKAGAGDVLLSAGGNYSITEIQGNGNNDLTFAANSNLTGGINTSGGQAVNLVFQGGGSVSGSVGSNAAVGDITIQAGAVNFGSTVKSGNVILSNGATMQVNNNVTATDISGENANDGTLKLNNLAPINITGTLGNNNTIGTIEVANNDATVTGGLKAQNINFSNAAQAATLTLGAAAQVTNITTAGNNIHTLAVTDLDTGNGVIGAANNRLKAIELTGNGTVTVNSKNFYSGITTANNGQGNVKLNIDGGIVYDLGSKLGSLASVQVSGNSTVKGDVYSKDINVDAGKTIDFDRGNNNTNPKNLAVPGAIVDLDVLPRSLSLFNYLTDIKADNLNFADATTTANFKDAVLIDAPINNGGTFKFNENVWLKQEITNAKSIEIASNKFMLLEKNIKADTLIADEANLVLLNNLEMNTNLNVRDVVLDVATYELKYTGNVTHNGLLTIITHFDTALQKGGHILVGNGANVDMSGLDNLIVKIKSRSDITKITSNTKHQVVALEAGGAFTPAPQAKVTIDASGEQNRFVKWVSDANGLVLLANTDNEGGDGGNGGDNGGGDGGNGGNGGNGGGNGGGGSGGGGNSGGGGAVSIFDPSPILDDTKNNQVASGIANQLINNVKGFGNNTDSGKLLNDLGLISPSRVSEALDRLGHRTNTNGINEGVGEFNGIEIEDLLTDIAINMDNLTSERIGNRLEELGDENTLSGQNEPNSNQNRRRRTSTTNNQAAVAAGDEDNIGTGIWGIPFYGKATQKSKNGSSGYKSNTGGGIIGFDYNIDNSIVIGAAYTMADSKVRHKNDKNGDRTKAKSNIYSIYGLYNWLTNNFFVEAIGSYGRNKVKNYEKRLTSTNDQTAIGKFTNTFYSGELLGGYNYLMSHLTTITPMIGIRYATFKNNSYKENSTTFQNLSIRKNSYNKFETILGLKGVTNYLVQDIIVKSELHGFINYNFKGKLPNIDARLDGIDGPLTTVRFKPAKITYNLGGGISTKYNMMEFGIRYNLSLAKKYMANQGSLKIKVNL